MKKQIIRFDEIMQERKALSTALKTIHWDLETETPKEGRELLSKTIGYLTLKSYELLTSKELMGLIEELSLNKNQLNETKIKEVNEIKKQIDDIKVIPAIEYAAYSELQAKANGIWSLARKNKDFSMFKDTLKEIIEYNRKFLEYRGFEGHPYNTFLGDYEPGMTVEKLDEFFSYLKSELVPFLNELQKNGRNIKRSFMFEEFPIEDQKKLIKKLSKYVGFDLDRGVISISTHPFALNFNKNDVRLTTRYELNNFSAATFGIIHESGHGMYEQGIADEIKDTPLGRGTSMGIHESQSRFYENMLGRRKEFWIPLYEDVKKEFKALENISLDEFYNGINGVKASFIRVEADELTYSLHIMVRYEIEKMLIEGSIEVDNLDEIWNEKMVEYLGIKPLNASQGVLQDVHWSSGLFGYFPSYALGNAYAAQLYKTMEKDIDILKVLEEGKLKEIKNWLKEKIHKFGKTKNPNELMIDITGEKLNAKYFVEYIKEKYTKIYL